MRKVKWKGARRGSGRTVGLGMSSFSDSTRLGGERLVRADRLEGIGERERAMLAGWPEGGDR